MRQTREPFPGSDAGIETSLFVAWLFTPEEWDARLGPGRPRALPYFPSRARSGASRAGDRIEFDAVDLFCGVLYCWSELLAPERCDEPAVRRRFLNRLLEDLRSEVGCPELDRLVVDAAFERGKDYGARASVPMLVAGRAICPESLPIRSDLVMDLWLLLVESGEVEIAPVCGRIVEAYEGIDLETLRATRPETAEQAVYLCGAALHLLGRHGEYKRHFRDVVQSVVAHPTLMDRLWRVARGEQLGFEDLQVYKPRCLDTVAATGEASQKKL